MGGGGGGGGKQSTASIAKCVAVTICQCLPEKQVQIITHLVEVVSSSSSSPSSPSISLLMGLLCLGEIGRRIDLGNIQNNIFPAVVGAFEAEKSGEEIKSAASFCLGGVIVGNLDVFLPIIVREIHENPRRRFIFFLILFLIFNF